LTRSITLHGPMAPAPRLKVVVSFRSPKKLSASSNLFTSSIFLHSTVSVWAVACCCDKRPPQTRRSRHHTPASRDSSNPRRQVLEFLRTWWPLFCAHSSHTKQQVWYARPSSRLRGRRLQHSSQRRHCSVTASRTAERQASDLGLAETVETTKTRHCTPNTPGLGRIGSRRRP
jgi:hypothetical protein